MFIYFDKFSNLKSFPTECDCCGKKLLNSVRVMRGKISLSRPSGFALLRLKANFVVFFLFFIIGTSGKHPFTLKSVWNVWNSVNEQKFVSTKWRTVLAHDVKGKPCNFKAYFCVDHCILLLKRLITNKRFQTLFIDQLARSQATCSFNVTIS